MLKPRGVGKRILARAAIGRDWLPADIQKGGMVQEWVVGRSPDPHAVPATERAPNGTYLGWKS